MKKIFLLALFVFAAFAINAQVVVTYQPALDTITDTESDTLSYTFPGRNHIYEWFFTSTSISGTDSLNVKLETSPVASGDVWFQLGSTFVSGGTGSVNLKTRFQGTLYAMRHRIIITGVGTQSTSYRLYGVFRRTT